MTTLSKADFLQEFSLLIAQLSELSEVKKKDLTNYIRNFVNAEKQEESTDLMEETSILMPMKNDEHFVAVAKHFGAKIVKDENNAEYVLFSPQNYQAFSALIEEIEDELDEKLADERMKNFDPNNCISAEELYKQCGLTEKDLEGFEDLELE